MSAADLTALCAWPLTGLGCWLAWKIRTLPRQGIRYWIMNGVATVLVAGPLLAVLSVLHNHSQITLAVQYSLLAGIGVLILFAAWRSRSGGAINSVLLTTAGFLMFGWGVWSFFGDFVLRHRQVEGTVLEPRYEQSSVSCTSRCAWDYFITFRGQRTTTTREVLETVTDGQRIRAAIGRGSGRILAVETLP
jgi:hypothetical protein